MEVCRHSYFWCYRYSRRSFGVICHGRWLFCAGQKYFFKEHTFFNEEKWLSKCCKPDILWSYNYPKLNVTNIRGISPLNQICLSDILALCETNREDSVESSKSSARYYLFLIGKDCYWCSWFRCHIKEGHSCHLTRPLKSLVILVYVFDWLNFI